MFMDGNSTWTPDTLIASDYPSPNRFLTSLTDHFSFNVTSMSLG